MMSKLAHRGPDGQGEYAADGVALGHTRLAIIDLGDAGLQPFASEDGTLQLIYNGEIYNYRELRAELEGKGHRFRSATDTEVVLVAYREWGDRCVERFNGMWAFALWDGRRRRLFCSRDRFGVKPFAYHWDGARFVFASEPSALREDGSLSFRPNERAVRDFIEQGYADHLDETFFEGIHHLPAAHSLVLDAGTLTIQRYWKLEPSAELPADPPAHFRELFLDAVRLRLRSDVRVGTALSGGLDSSAIVGMIDHLLRTEHASAASVGARQQTFTAFFEDRGFDERPYAEAVVTKTGAEAHWVSFRDDELVDVLPRVVEAQGEPFGSTSIAAQWYVMRSARLAGVTVMLDGQGGDEVLAGYPTTFPYLLADAAAAGRFGAVARECSAYRRVQGGSVATVLGALMLPFLPRGLLWHLRARRGGAHTLLGPSLPAMDATRERAPVENLPDRLRRRYGSILLERGLPELLRYEDRNSMAHSIEARVPFLDYRIAELTFGLEAEELVRDGFTKRLLRNAVADVLPPMVRERPDKLGFVTPEARFFRGALGDMAGDVFSSRAFAERGLVNAPVARKRLAAHRAGETTAGPALWRALSVELWARACLDS
jgi:asparagine synthase (glutamine-hydrolysing)